MHRNQDLVSEFHQVYAMPSRPFEQPAVVEERCALRLSLITEELNEFADAVAAKAMTQAVDGLGDLLYVVYGTGVEFGIDIDKHVHALAAVLMPNIERHRLEAMNPQLLAFAYERLLGHAGPPEPSIPEESGVRRYRMAQMLLYVEALSSALAARNLERTEDALARLTFSIYSTGFDYGIDLNAAMQLIHASNMSKLGADGKPIYRADGKVLKGPNFFEPDFSSLFAPKGN